VTHPTQFSGCWTVVLGGSSGFGLATVKKLSRHGMNLAVLYRETSIGHKAALHTFKELEAENGNVIRAYNLNALDAADRERFVNDFKKHNNGGKVKLLLHSIARGNVKPLICESSEPGDALSIEDIQLTTYAMSNSLLDWVRLLLNHQLFDADARVIGLTSEGAHKYWNSYAAVSLAKSSLESLATYLAVETARFGIKTNVIQAGITATPSLLKIPDSDQLLNHATARNPLGRMTTPEDVANVIYLLCTPEAAWINGSIIYADGGEHCR